MRRRTQRCLKIICFVVFGLFLSLQISSVLVHNSPTNDNAVPGARIEPPKHVTDQTFQDLGSYKFPSPLQRDHLSTRRPIKSNPKAVLDASLIEEDRIDHLEIPANNSLAGNRVHGLPPKEVGNGTKDAKIKIPEVLEQIKVLNQQQFVRNEELFGPISNGTIVIAIQVHNRLQYLRQLIVSLSQARDIEKSLLVFSHDFWDPAINSLISSIDFAKYIQIFYPYSIQTHPNEFPGESPDDCPRDATKESAKAKKCKNAHWPDLYGHYREAKFTQTKHHWWWKANRIFDQLEVTKHHTGLVLFLEEDHHVAEDFLHVLNLAHAECQSNQPNCDIICLGSYLKHINYQRNHKTADLTQWISAKHNMGMAFDREIWRKLHHCRAEFCSFDDYNWDWSLQHVSSSCLPERMQVLLLKAPRVFHIGECGVHHKKKDCQTSKVVSKVQDILKAASKYLYPMNLVVTKSTLRKKPKTSKGNGGWGDRRDKALCMNMALPLAGANDVDTVLSAAQLFH
ncbi:alpha-1,6-mannosyl-glycoprotein 2-beta-N-acetylglucosaminyltransferase-like isoform X3 [Tigriopus californicus]|uniref:alpha-1,6-mannosyl-glycoprotein 2-beta-N-acetylglucosaminyltransferase-like isoform X3 n=1 Tax=Tigriopus californicus TaxID=6832 RepID=UPI0027DA92E8|nr:alpha-1,6-mannosyl-glycoprotein 2-beta-N-acetylglucosaminyltransferase-like isoform X3 [Tigriopus californicus]